MSPPGCRCPAHCLKCVQTAVRNPVLRCAPCARPTHVAASALHPAFTMASQGYSLPKCNGFLPVPFTRHFPIFAGAIALTMAASWLNDRNFSPVESMSPDFKAAEAKGIINRTEAPPVFINPIDMGLPGNILGPEDLEARNA